MFMSIKNNRNSSRENPNMNPIKFHVKSNQTITWYSFFPSEKNYTCLSLDSMIVTFYIRKQNYSNVFKDSSNFNQTPVASMISLLYFYILYYENYENHLPFLDTTINQKYP